MTCTRVARAHVHTQAQARSVAPAYVLPDRVLASAEGPIARADVVATRCVRHGPAVVGGEYDHRVFQHALCLQRGRDVANAAVHRAEHPSEHAPVHVVDLVRARRVRVLVVAGHLRGCVHRLESKVQEQALLRWVVGVDNTYRLLGEHLCRVSPIRGDVNLRAPLAAPGGRIAAKVVVLARRVLEVVLTAGVEAAEALEAAERRGVRPLVEADCAPVVRRVCAQSGGMCSEACG